MFIETGTNIVEKIKLYFDQDTEVFCKEYRETISLAEIKESWFYCIKNSIIPKNCCGILLDYREAKFDMKTREIYELVEFYNTHVSKVKQRRIAILTERPDQIIIPSLLMQKSKKHNIQVFTSLNASLRWVRY